MSFCLRKLVLVLLTTHLQELFVLFQQGNLLLRVLLEVLEIVLVSFVACLSLFQFLSQGVYLRLVDLHVPAVALLEFRLGLRVFVFEVAEKQI